MADEMDPCECIWNHEMAMRRLLSWLRESQSDCTDTECIIDLPRSSPDLSSNYLMMTLFVVFAIALYMLRPKSLRNRANSDAKPFGGNSGNNGTPPTPPPAVM